MVGVKVLVGVKVGVNVGVSVGVGVSEGVGVGVSDGVGVLDGVLLGVGLFGVWRPPGGVLTILEVRNVSTVAMRYEARCIISSNPKRGRTRYVKL